MEKFRLPSDEGGVFAKGKDGGREKSQTPAASRPQSAKADSSLVRGSLYYSFLLITTAVPETETRTILSPNEFSKSHLTPHLRQAQPRFCEISS